MIASPASIPWPTAPAAPATTTAPTCLIFRTRAVVRIAVAATFAILSAAFTALDILVIAPTRRAYVSHSGASRRPIVRFVGSDPAELVARGRVALAGDEPGLASYLFDRAAAADPSNEDAWLLKASCLEDPVESISCLQAGLTANPSSTRLMDAFRRGTAPGPAR